MAEGFLWRYRAHEFTPASAGTEPKSEVHPLAIQVMKEVGIDIAAHRPKDLAVLLGRAPVRHIIVVCDKANGTCPRIWPGALTRTYLPFDDPAELVGSDAAKLTEFRRVRDEIGRAIRDWKPAIA
jgi:arsenate reductase